MISRKDKYGLIRDGSDMTTATGEEEDSSRDNPVIEALEKVKIRQQSLDSDSMLKGGLADVTCLVRKYIFKVPSEVPLQQALRRFL